MPYKFTFDLSKIPRVFFTEVTRIGYEKGLHRRVGKALNDVIGKFKIQEITGLPISEAVTLIEDFVEMQARNVLEREKFAQTKKRAVFLPHCSRKYMDGRCKATFDQSIPSYICAHCSPDCLVNKSSTVAEKKGYDVYIVPGGSCIPKILKEKGYDGIVGVACGEEIRMSGELLRNSGIAGQAIPLLKNGCANTCFNVETLLTTL